MIRLSAFPCLWTILFFSFSFISNPFAQNAFFQNEHKPEAGFCDVIGKNCILRSGDFKVSLYQEDGLTTLNSTFPLDTATLFLVDDTGGVSPYQMGMKESPYYWFQKTAIEKVHANAGSKQLIRLILTIKGGQYVGEFLSTNVGDRVTVEKGSI